MTERPRTPASLDHLYAEIADLVAAVTDAEREIDGQRDDSKCAEAMWRAGYMAVEYVASQLGMTGFQHSYAMLKLYQQAMHIDGPFMVLQVHDALYPQYDLQGRVWDFVQENHEWLAGQARTMLAEYEANPTLTYTDDDGRTVTRPRVAPRVVEHWRGILASEPIR